MGGGTPSSNGVVLYKNPDPTKEMSASYISLSSGSADFDLYEIYCCYSVSKPEVVDCCRIMKGAKGALQVIISDSDNPTLGMRMFEFIKEPESGMNGIASIGQGRIYQFNSNSLTKNNAACIPLYIIGYKTGLFS